MQYAQEATSQDLVSQIQFYSATSLTDYPLTDITRNVNIAYHEAAQIIQGADGTWKWDDANNTTLPIGTTDLVLGQRDYNIDDSMLEIERLECLDASGTARVLTPIDQSEITEPYSTFQSVAGTPKYYDKVGTSLYLFPAANYNSTAGLTIHFKRSASTFETVDTTKTPGFNVRFHDFLALSAALAYCKRFKPDLVPQLVADKQTMAQEMREFYSRRPKDTRQGMRVSRISAK